MFDLKRSRTGQIETTRGGSVPAHLQPAPLTSAPSAFAFGARLRPSQVPITQPGDAVEQQADELADRMAPRSAGTYDARRSPLACAPSTVWAAVNSPGRPLSDDERPAALGIDWAGVRVHAGSSAAESARELAAAAYTVSNHIVLGDGYNAHSAEGRRLLAHELAHVAQQQSHPERMVVHRQGAQDPAGPENKSPTGTASAAAKDTAAKSVQEVLRLDQTVPLKGLATEQPNYVDRAVGRIESAPLGPDITLIPRAGGQGISILKGDFFIDEDPLSGFVIAQNQVYRSREVAATVVAELNLITPGVNYAYYLQDGLILPTVLSNTTIPNLIKSVRAKRDQDIQGFKATADLAKALLWWYVGARFPVKVGGTGVAAGGTTAARAVFDAAKIADELTASTGTIVNAGEKMLAAGRQLSTMGGLTAVQKVDVMLEFFKRIGFAISKAGVVDDGARFIMYSEDSRYAFAFVKDTAEILYGKFDAKALQYVWQALK